MQLKIDSLVVRYKSLVAVDRLSLQLATGEIGCLLGPSGCGKTTVLRTIAGFETPDAGEIILHDRSVSKAEFSIPTEHRNVGMVFQDFALFPHLTVHQNIAFGLNRLSSSQQNTRVSELLDWTELSPLAYKYPHQLSGGQQQRVALARAIAPKPTALLLDEPFSNIDIELREQLARDIRKLLKAENITGLLVTHDQNEAFAVADKIGVMNQGHLHQWDSGYQLYHKPADFFVADFIGRGVFISGEVTSKQLIKTELGELHYESAPKELNPGDKAHVLIRPDDIVHDDNSPRTARVIDKSFQGADFLYTLELETGARVLCYAPSHHDHAINEAIGIRIEMDHLVAFRA